MVEPISCPVCTLYLRPGMSLEEHLETHPKEQVIRALVSLAKTSTSTDTSVSATSNTPPNAIGTLLPNKIDQFQTQSQPQQQLQSEIHSLSLLPIQQPRCTKRQDNTVDSESFTSRNLSRLRIDDDSITRSEASMDFLNSNSGQNVMIVNRHSTVQVYQSTENPHRRVLGQNFPMSTPSLQVFNVSHHNQTNSLPPPPAYGTAINQIRSQQSQSNYHTNMNVHQNNQNQYQNYSGYQNQNNHQQQTNPQQQQQQHHQQGQLLVNNNQQPNLQNHSIQSSQNTRFILPRPSPSPSVLRFADSPISAHYVERENGDFIVQESPRHVVECFEKDDGAFSVIEKVIKSPPCVVQFSDYERDESSPKSSTIVSRQAINEEEEQNRNDLAQQQRISTIVSPSTTSLSTTRPLVTVVSPSVLAQAPLANDSLSTSIQTKSSTVLSSKGSSNASPLKVPQCSPLYITSLVSNTTTSEKSSNVASNALSIQSSEGRKLSSSIANKTTSPPSPKAGHSKIKKTVSTISKLSSTQSRTIQSNDIILIPSKPGPSKLANIAESASSSAEHSTSKTISINVAGTEKSKADNKMIRLPSEPKEPLKAAPAKELTTIISSSQSSLMKTISSTWTCPTKATCNLTDSSSLPNKSLLVESSKSKISARQDIMKLSEPCKTQAIENLLTTTCSQAQKYEQPVSHVQTKQHPCSSPTSISIPLPSSSSKYSSVEMNPNKSVTVLSNVKLRSNNCLDLMEDTVASTNEEKHLHNFEKKISNVEYPNNDIKVDDVKLDDTCPVTKPDDNSPTTTSVIRIAKVVGGVSLENVSSCSETSRKSSWEHSLTKKHFKKPPKKLIVKLKSRPDLIVQSSENSTTTVTEIPKPTLLIMEDSASTLQPPSTLMSTVFTGDKNSTMLTDAACVGESILTEQSKALMNSINIIDENNKSAKADIRNEQLFIEEKLTTSDLRSSPAEDLDKETSIKMEIANSAVVSMIVHESSLNVEHSTETDDVENKSSETYNAIAAESGNADNKEAEFSKLLDECWKNEMRSVELGLIVADADKTIFVNSGNIVEVGSEATDSCRGDSSSFNSFPSTSTFSKPSTSSLTIREQTDYNQAQNYNDYTPFSFLYSNEKYPSSPVYAFDEQPWTPYAMFEQRNQIQPQQESDGDRNSYIDLDSYKRSTGIDGSLNIRTDEKMPAKGEISEQESNGDIENSLSQPLCQEPNYRFSNPYENYVTRESWSLSNDEILYPQDLSSTARPKFSFIPPNDKEVKNVDTITIATKPPSKKKKSKLLSRKEYQCAHCPLAFPMLKERTLHLIEKHGYTRVNRRLIRNAAPATITTGDIVPTENVDEDVKPPIVKSDIGILNPIDSSTYPRTKYDSIRAGVYRMLMNFNLKVLKDKTNVEVDWSLFESKSFCCYTCKRDFISVKLFDEHLADHPAECFTCNRKFTRWSYFSLHLKRHLGWKDFACTVCHKKFVIRSAMVEHMRTHTGNSPLKCKMCDKHFKRYSNLTQHKRSCHGTKITAKKEYVCHCGEVLPSRARFLWHKETHDTKPKCCPYCRDRFVHVNSLKRHIRLTHSDKFMYIQPVECPVCKQVYAKASLKAHMTTHSLDTQHECPICNKSFSTKWNLKIHSWVHANRTAKPFKCEHCTKAFVREIDYKNHCNSHKHIKPFTCEYCGCKFIRKYNYMRHRREHHGQKKFVCDLCGKRFHRNYYLIEHRRTHTGERPFLCTICGKSSTTKTNHNKHLKIHHSRDPFTSEA